MARRSELRSFRVSWWDRFLIGIAPRWGARRLRVRASALVLKRGYDAAGTGRRTAGWHRSSADANSASAGSLVKLRELSRDLRRNNGWARRGIQVIGNNTVGWGIQPKADGVGDELAARALEVWSLWADTSRCDFDGRMPFTGLQRLVMNTVVESGEALIVREAANGSDGLPVPMRIRVLEPDFLDTLKSGKGSAGGRIKFGIESDGRGRRAAYWLHENHPGDAGLLSLGRESKRVAASDVIHVYYVERAGQLRGVGWLAAAIAKLNDFDDYDDAVLMQQKIAACFAAFVEDLDGSAPPVGDQDADDEQIETLEPGHISYLSPGQKVSFSTPPSTSNHGSFSAESLRRIAASLGVTYEDLTGDYSKVNFSSARMARLAHWANVHDWRWHMLIPQMCDGVWSWVMEMAKQLEGWSVAPRALWSPPPMPMLEPEKEGLAYSRLVRSGVMTLYDALRQRGEDPASHLAEYAASNKKLDDLEIVLDSDARRTSGAGLAQPEQSDAE